MPLTILVTGGAGFVGSHTIIELLNAGHTVVGVDNLCNAYCEKSEAIPESLKRVEQITGKKVIFHQVDIRERSELDVIFKKVSFVHNAHIIFCI
jgi:UDP-glucose 4-epimerase